MDTKQFIQGLFDTNPEVDILELRGKCHDCGTDVCVEMEIGEKGKLLVQGGAFYTPELDSRAQNTKDKYFKCDSCFGKDNILRNYQQCEVFSRVVGYFRPVKQWNAGKTAEYKMRVPFKL